ncbi:MAG: hypothetical protein ACHQ9S_27885 [Candidatus Binatia bacterium]
MALLHFPYVQRMKARIDVFGTLIGIERVGNEWRVVSDLRASTGERVA